MKLSPCLSKAFALNCLSISAIALFLLFPDHPLQAQIVPDDTLPVNSLVTSDANSFVINGGTSRGNNLFHSFAQFSLPTGSTALFNNSGDIQNIISRVTGGSISNIDGVIQANGTANLFFLNPKGIVFGPNASLNIGGSFLGSTATSINFADGTTFSATNPKSQSLLTVSIPVGLGFGSNPGAIRVQNTGHSLTVADPLVSPITGVSDSSTGLRVQAGKTLALVGGNVTLEGGILTAPEGRIELGSVGSGSVNISPTPQGFTLGYQGVQDFHNIQLAQRSLADASGNGGGSIQVQGANVTLTDDSVILIQNQGLQPAGNLSVHASESLQLLDPMPSGAINSGIFNETVGIGNGGDIEVITQRLVVQDGASIQARTFSTATGGNITVNASKSAQVVGFSPLNSTAFSSISTSALNSGGVGKLIVSTERLTVLDGGAVISTTFGAGNAGDVIVKATESIEVSGAEPSLLAPSLIASTTLYNGLDQKKGNAGNVRIDTRQLLVRDGGRVDSSTLASGNAGSVIINASESVKVSGRFSRSVNPSLIISSANIIDPVLRQALGLPDQPSGDSGNVTINTPHLSVTDGAQVTVRNDGTGRAGTLIINADSILLDNQGGITASTNAGESAQEGSITLNVRDSLQMRHNSVISAEARGAQRGGNIIINAGAIAPVPEENSDITASAPQGTGGRITINTQGIFGTQVRDQQTPESDIIAVGKTPEFNGIVQVNTPEINVQAALNQLNGNFITTEQAIASSCFARRNVEQGTFTVTGTGGLPTTPYDAIGGRYAVTQVQALPNSARQQTSSPAPNPPSAPAQSWKLGDPIQEAQGMSITPDGRIIVGTNPQLAAIADPQTLICHLTVRPKAEVRGQKG